MLDLNRVASGLSVSPGVGVKPEPGSAITKSWLSGKLSTDSGVWFSSLIDPACFDSYAQRLSRLEKRTSAPAIIAPAISPGAPKANSGGGIRQASASGMYFSHELRGSIALTA